MQGTVGEKFIPIVASDLVNPHNNPKKKELSSRPFCTYQRHPTDRLAQTCSTGFSSQTIPSFLSLLPYLQLII